MKIKMFAIYDNKVEAYMLPFFALTPAQADRNFADLVADKNTPVGRHPGDHILYLIGGFDDRTGEVAQEAVTRISSGADHVDNT